MRKINPLNDVVFKKVMGEHGDEVQLKAFIEAVLGREYASIEIVGATELTPETFGNKLIRLDVLAILSDGSSVNIEVQLKDQNNMDKRSLFHWQRLFGRELKAGKDSNFADLTAVITINILGFTFFDEPEFHNSYHIRNDKSGSILTDSLEIHFIEMPKFLKLREKDVKNNALHRWLTFFDSNINEKILEEMIEMDTAIRQAETRFERISNDAATLRLIQLREEGEWEYYATLNEAKKEALTKGREEGLAEGLAEGHAQGRAEGHAQGRAEGHAQGRAEGERNKALETAKILLKSNVDIKLIALSTGLTEYDIINLK